jgi:hypothetical protein
MGIRTFADCRQESSYAPPPVWAAVAASSSLRLAAVTERTATSAGARPVLRSTLAYLAMLVALALLVATVWAFGGFRKRTDILRPVPPGQPFTSGPYEFSFSGATVQQIKKSDGSLSWKVKVLGQGRTTGKEAMSLTHVESENGIFVLKDPSTGQIVVPDGEQFGIDDSFNRHNFTPGLPPIAYTLSFTLDGRYQPGRFLQFAALDLVYGSHYLTTEEKAWHNGTYATKILLPVRLLPAQKS